MMNHHRGHMGRQIPTVAATPRCEAEILYRTSSSQKQREYSGVLRARSTPSRGRCPLVTYPLIGALERGIRIAPEW